MPTVLSHPTFRVHDRHPMLHGLGWLALCLLLLAVFLLSVLPGVWSLMATPDCAGPAAQLPV